MMPRSPRFRLLISPAIALLFIALTALISPALARANPNCEQSRPAGTQKGTISDAAIDESSGLAASWRDHGLLWTHNDSGDSARLWAMDKAGQVLTEVRLTTVDAVDWEDMAIGPCAAESDEPCIYIGDFGDNLARRESVLLHRFPEPDLSENPPAILDIDSVETLTLRYDGGPRDGESLLVHPKTAEIWIIDKTGESPATVFSVPANFDSEEEQLATAINTIEIAGPVALTRMITAADIAPDGSEFTLRTYLDLYTFCVDGDDFESAFNAEPIISRVLPPTIQGEALTYDRQDHSIWLTSERLPAPLIRMPLAENPSDQEDNDDQDQDQDQDQEQDQDQDDPSDEESDTDEADENARSDFESTQSAACSSLAPAGTDRSLFSLVLFLSAMVIARSKFG